MNRLVAPDPNNQYAHLDPEVREINDLMLAHYSEAIKQTIAQMNLVKPDGTRKNKGKLIVHDTQFLCLHSHLYELRQEFEKLSGIQLADLTNAQVIKALVKVAATQEIVHAENKRLSDEAAKRPQQARGKMAALADSIDGTSALDVLKNLKRKGGKGNLPADKVSSEALADTV